MDEKTAKEKIGDEKEKGEKVREKRLREREGIKQRITKATVDVMSHSYWRRPILVGLREAGNFRI